MVDFTQTLSQPSLAGINIASGVAEKPKGFNPVPALEPFATVAAQGSKTSSGGGGNPAVGAFFELESQINSFNAGLTEEAPAALVELSRKNATIKAALEQGSISPALADITRDSLYKHVVNQGVLPEEAAKALDMAVKSPIANDVEFNRSLLEDARKKIQNDYIQQTGMPPAVTIDGQPNFELMSRVVSNQKALELQSENIERIGKITTNKLFAQAQVIVNDDFSKELSLIYAQDEGALNALPDVQRGAIQAIRKGMRGEQLTAEDIKAQQLYLTSKVQETKLRANQILLSNPSFATLSQEQKNSFVEKLTSSWADLAQDPESVVEAAKFQQELKEYEFVESLGERAVAISAFKRIAGPEFLNGFKTLYADEELQAYATDLFRGIGQSIKSMNDTASGLERNTVRDPQGEVVFNPISAEAWQSDLKNTQGKTVQQLLKQGWETAKRMPKDKGYLTATSSFTNMATHVTAPEDINGLFKELKTFPAQAKLFQAAEKDPISYRQFFDSVLDLSAKKYARVEDTIKGGDFGPITTVNGVLPGIKFKYNPTLRKFQAVADKQSSTGDKTSLKNTVVGSTLGFGGGSSTPVGTAVLLGNVALLSNRQRKVDNVLRELNEINDVVSLYGEKAKFKQGEIPELLSVIFSDTVQVVTPEETLDIPEEAINELRSNPSPEAQRNFDAAFGDGASNAVLSND